MRTGPNSPSDNADHCERRIRSPSWFYSFSWCRSVEEEVLVVPFALASEVDLAGALEAVEVGAFPAVEDGLAGMPGG